MFEQETKRNRRKGRKSRPKQQESSLFLPTKRRRLWIWLTVVILLVGLLAGFLVKDNRSLSVTQVTIRHTQLPASFDGFRILQISDFHGKNFGTMQKRLIELVNRLEYDILVLTGDYLADPESDDLWVIVDLLEGLTGEKPVYYVLGESDYPAPEGADDDWNMCIDPPAKTPLMMAMEERGARFVYPIQRIQRGEDAIYLTGIKYAESSFDKLDFDMDKHFSICVTHKPITYNVSKRLESVNEKTLREVDYDVCLSGHTHGGQFRLPLLGALYSDEKGFFPQEQYSYGLHTDANGRATYITSGLGSSGSLPIRLFNTPEVALITLRCADTDG